MLHGQRLVLLVYLHLTLVVQYNIILIIINSIYTILLFANKQWGTVSQSVSQETEISFPINFKSNCYFIIGNDILDTTGNILTLFAFRNINTSVFIRNAVVFGKGGGITFGQVKFCYYLTMGK